MGDQIILKQSEIILKYKVFESLKLHETISHHTFRSYM